MADPIVEITDTEGQAFDDEYVIRTKTAVTEPPLAEEIVTQVINFPVGWSTFGLFIDPHAGFAGSVGTFSNSASVVEMFNDVPDLSVLTQVKNNDAITYIPQYGYNGIGDLINGQGYYAHATQSFSITITGPPISTNDGSYEMLGMTIDLVNGWNMITPTIQIEDNEFFNVAVVFEDLASTGNLTMVKDSSGMAFLPAWSMNNIGNLTEGVVYFVHVTAPSSVTITK
jgi:hypothetical protein